VPGDLASSCHPCSVRTCAADPRAPTLHPPAQPIAWPVLERKMSASDMSDCEKNESPSQLDSLHRMEASRFDSVPCLGPFTPRDVIGELGDGLVVRRGTPADSEALARFNGVAHAEPQSGSSAGAAGSFDPCLAEWTADLTNGRHPTARASDFIIVEDTRRHRIASTLALLSHRFRYGDVELAAGQPELVGTHPEYRRRGLIDHQLDIIHRASESRGDLLQVIDGIPWYYRQFGYEMALEQAATRLVQRARPVDSSQSEEAPNTGSHRVRAAGEGDLDFIASCQERDAERLLLHCMRDEAFLRYELTQRNPQSVVLRH
jgi:hypothetical protein